MLAGIYSSIPRANCCPLLLNNTLDTPGFNPQAFWKQWHARLLLVLLGSTPVFLVTVRSWSGAILILGAMACAISLARDRAARTLMDDGARYGPALVLTFLAPLCVIGITSTLRGRHAGADYDSASRFMLGALVFAWALRSRLSILHILQVTIPVGLLCTLVQQWVVPQHRQWGEARMSTHFADPLVFGYTSLTLGLICLVSIHLLGKDGRALLVLKLIGAVAGFYMSVQSGSRTGWLAAPVILGVWWHYRLEGRGPARSGRWLLLCASVALLAGFAASGTVQQRVSMAVSEVVSYPWTGIAPETSIGLRISFLRIATELLSIHPFMGYGDTYQRYQILPPVVYTYASEEAWRTALDAGFHNEVVTQAVRSGVLGMLSAIALFFVPLGLFARQMGSANAVRRGNALAGLVLVTGFLISSLSTEVFDLKYMASFYALMVALLAASALGADAGSFLPNAFATSKGAPA